eukprot:403362627
MQDLRAPPQYNNNYQNNIFQEQIQSDRVINGAHPQDFNINSRMQYKCLQVSDFSSISQSTKYANNQQSDILSVHNRKNSLFYEQQNKTPFKLDPFSIIGIKHTNVKNKKDSNQNNSKIQLNENHSKNNKIASDHFNTSKNTQNVSQIQSVPIKTKLIYQKVPSRSTNSSPKFKVKRSKRGSESLGFKNIDQDLHYKLPSMAQFLQKSILPKKQSIINEVYIQKLNKFQNLVSIVGSGNMRLANNLAKDDADYNIQKCLIKEIKKQKLINKEQNELLSDISSQKVNQNLFGLSFFNRENQEMLQKYQTKSKNQGTMKNRVKHVSASTSTDLNRELINNYNGLLIKNQKKISNKESKSLIVTPQRSQSKVKSVSSYSPTKKNSKFDWKQAYKQNVLSNQSIQLDHNQQKQNVQVQNVNYHEQRKGLNSMIEKRLGTLQKNNLKQDEDFMQQEVINGQKDRRYIKTGIKIQNNSTTAVIVDMNQKGLIDNKEINDKHFKFSNQSASGRSLIMIKKKGAIQRAQYLSESPIDDTELNSQAVESTDREAEFFQRKVEDEINTTLKEFETFHNVTSQGQMDQNHNQTLVSKELSPSNHYMNPVEYKQMPLVNYQFPLQSKFSVEHAKVKAFTPSIPKRFQFYRDKRPMQTLSDTNQISGMHVLNLQKTLEKNSYDKQTISLNLSSNINLNNNQNRNSRFQRTTEDKIVQKSESPVKLIGAKRSIDKRQELKLHINDHANTLNENTLDHQTYDSRVKDENHSISKDKRSTSKQQNSFGKQSKKYQDINMKDKKLSPSIRQRISVNNVINQALGIGGSKPKIYDIEQSNKQLSLNRRVEEILQADDDLSSKALNSTTFIKQLDNRYQNSQIFDNLFENLLDQDEFQMYPKIHTSKRQISKEGIKNQFIDYPRPKQIRGQLFSMPISPLHLKHKNGEFELKQKRNNNNIIRERIDGGETTQIISSKLVHKQFQIMNNLRKSTNLSNNSNNNSPMRQLSIDLRI